MYRDFIRSIEGNTPPEMSLERAIDDQRLMDQIYGSIGRSAADALLEPPAGARSSSQ
jgi:predicted dehydrogenase